jgi:hypothetical protein
MDAKLERHLSSGLGDLMVLQSWRTQQPIDAGTAGSDLVSVGRPEHGKIM